MSCLHLITPALTDNPHGKIMDHSSSTKYDAELQKIPHYQAFPLMMPYVGPHYESEGHKKLLLIGESFYLPPESTVHKNHTEWYQKNASVLNEEEIRYLDCRGLLENNTRHKMYHEIDRCLRTCLSGLKDGEQATTHIAYTNAFLRPAAESGKSFRYCCEHEETALSVQVTDTVVKALQPDLVIYLSICAWDYAGWQVADLNPTITFDHTCHPTAHFYWKREGYPRGYNKFIQLLKSQFIQ